MHAAIYYNIIISCIIYVPACVHLVHPLILMFLVFFILLHLKWKEKYEYFNLGLIFMT